ncbi:MAG: NYN domain-containing protein [Abditibacteriales bacterium]|nr:NYN domain-containing protein [Abditibacteriales bacterium]
MEDEHTLAVFIDFENIALGFQGRGTVVEFDIHRVLERLVEKGKVIVKKAYADWGRYPKYKDTLHQAAIELIEIPKRFQTGKNSADIRLVVDAMDLCYSKEHIDTFVIVSGDSDFSPLVSKLKENGKRVIGLSMKASTSDLLANNCDEFIFYEDLEAASSIPSALSRNIPKEKREVFELLIETIIGLQRENNETLWSSLVKDTMKRKKPSFSESAYGYRSFSDLLEDAERHGLIELNINSRSGTYVVAGLAGEAATSASVTATLPPPPELERPRTATRVRRRTWRRT